MLIPWESHNDGLLSGKVWTFFLVRAHEKIVLIFRSEFRGGDTGRVLQ